MFLKGRECSLQLLMHGIFAHWRESKRHNIGASISVMLVSFHNGTVSQMEPRLEDVVPQTSWASETWKNKTQISVFHLHFWHENTKGRGLEICSFKRFLRWCNSDGVGNTELEWQTKPGLLPVFFLNKVLLTPSHTHSFLYPQWLVSCWQSSWVVILRLCDLQSLK